MALTLHWTLPDPAKTSAVFSSIKVFRAARQDGIFAEVSTPDTRPQLRPDVARYTYTDEGGSADAWYCSSFYSPQSRAESSRSTPQRGAGDPVFSIISVAQLKERYLFGLKMADKLGRPVPDAVFETGLRTAVAWLERSLGFRLLPTVVVDEGHDYRMDRQVHYGLVHVNQVPLQSVQGMRLRLPGSSGGQFSFPVPDLVCERWDGSIAVVPQGSSTIYPQLQMLWSQMWRSPSFAARSYVPGAVRLDYTAGFASGEVPADLVDLVAKSATIHVLAISGDLIGPPGVSSSSISLDGLGQSIGRTASQTGNAYAARSSAYAQQLQTDIPKLRAAYLGLRLRVP